MADFPEKDLPETEEGFENSTIFSNPTAHKVVEIKKKRVWTKVLAAFLCFAVVVAGTVAVVQLIPVPEEEQENPFAQEISIKSVEADSISKVTVTNAVGTTVFCSDTVDESVEWYIKSIDKELTESMEISNLVDAVANINGFRKITEKTAKDCGLESPAIKAMIETRKEDKYTVLLGDISPDNSGYYLKIVGSEDIYTVSSDLWDTLDFELLDFATTDMISGFDNSDGELDEYYSNGALSRFDKIVIKGKNYPEAVEIIRNQDEDRAQYLGYIVTKPTTRIAENTDALLALFQSGITVTGAYSYDVKSETLKKLGLDNPDLQLTMTVGKKSLTYKFALQDDGSYAAVYDDSKLIHQVSTESLEGIIEFTTTDYYSSWICYNFIDDLSNFTIKTEDKDYNFDIVKNETEEDAESEEEQEGYTITHKGKKLTALNFQYLYQYCATLRCTDFVVEDVTAKPSISFIFNFKDGTDSIIEFVKVSATRYQYRVDGIDMGRVAVNSINKVITNAEKVAKGETINQLF